MNASILNISCGVLSNFVTTHYFNIDDEYEIYNDDKKIANPKNELLYYTYENSSGRIIHQPRLISIAPHSTFYDADYDHELDNSNFDSFNWSGNTRIIKQNNNNDDQKKHPFQLKLYKANILADIKQLELKEKELLNDFMNDYELNIITDKIEKLKKIEIITRVTK